MLYIHRFLVQIIENKIIIIIYKCLIQEQQRQEISEIEQLQSFHSLKFDEYETVVVRYRTITL